MASCRTQLLVAVASVLLLGIQDSTAQSRNCPDVCTADYNPVCGRKADGSTMEFSNSCWLTIYQCNNPGVIVSSSRGRC